MKITEIKIELMGKLEIGCYEGLEEKFNERMIVIDGIPLDDEISLLDGEEVIITICKRNSR